MKCQIKINHQRPSLKVGSTIIKQSCLGLSTASLIMQPDVKDPLTVSEINRLLGARVSLSWPAGGKKPQQHFTGVVDEILPSLSDGQQFLQLNVVTMGELMWTSPSFRVFTGRKLDYIVHTIAKANGRTISFSGNNPSIAFSVQQYENDITYLSRLAEANGKLFYHDGQSFYFKDWVGTEEAMPLSKRYISSIDAAYNLTPIHLNLKGRLLNAKHLTPLNTAVQPPSSEPMASVFQRSADLYDEAPMSLSHFIMPEEASRYHDRLLRRQARQMVKVALESTHPDMKLGQPLTFPDSAILPAGQRFRVAEIIHEFGARGTYANRMTILPDEPLSAPQLHYVSPPAQCYALRGVVEQVGKKENLGQATISFPEADYADTSPLFSVLGSYTGSGGAYLPPDPGDEVVLLAFNGNIEQAPVIIGTFYSANVPASQWQHKDGSKKGWQAGNVGIFLDKESGKLILQADEIVLSAGKDMLIDAAGELVQKARLIKLNP